MATAEEFKAYTCAAKGKDFELVGYEPEPLGPTDIQIKVTHNGLCHTDIHMRDNDWNNAVYPMVCGHEVVGTVEKVGANVTEHKVGDRVAYGWMRDSCRSCFSCKQGEENLCVKGYTGILLNGNKGGFQYRLRAPAYFAIPLPEGMDSVDAAPLMCAGITVYSPLRTWLTRPGMRVGVLGIGGLGHLAIQFARAMGAHVTAFSTSPSKEAEAKKFGAHSFVVYDPNAAPGAGYFAGAGGNQVQVDVLVNCSPALPPDGDFRNMMFLLNKGGVLVLTGIPPDSLGKFWLIDAIFNQKKIAGSVVGGRVHLQEMFEFCVTHGIKPQTQTRKLSELNQAIKDVLDNKARYRYVLITDE